jgi:hypothetical protein
LGNELKIDQNEISPDYIIKGFKRCHVSIDMNGKDDVLQDEDQEGNSSSDESVDSDWLNK